MIARPVRPLGSLARIERNYGRPVGADRGFSARSHPPRAMAALLS